jgi:CRISPR-associated endoribonuclease Cas6
MQGQVIAVALQLRGGPKGALSQLPYLGGVLHGLLRHQWFECDPKRVRWAVLAPAAQPGTRAQWVDENGCLHFGVLWHGDADWPALHAAAALQRLQTISLGMHRHPVAAVHTQVQPWLGYWPSSAQQSQAARTTVTAEVTAYSPAPASPLTLSLHWCTPLHMASRARVAAGAGNLPPTLLAILRSLHRRATELEPEWAQAWGMDTMAQTDRGSAWVADMEKIRAAQTAASATTDQTRPFAWPYGSRTKAQPFERHGLLGRQTFCLALPPAVQALLHLGMWLGAGEGSSFGCGRYTLCGA